MKKTMRVYNIKWDTGDCIDIEIDFLPTEVEVPKHLTEFEIANYLSNIYRWRVESFVCDELNKINKVNVFVLSTEQFTDEGFWSDVLGVFKTIEEAITEMFKHIKEWREYNGSLANEYEIDLDSDCKMRYVNENGDYVEWTISNFTV